MTASYSFSFGEQPNSQISRVWEWFKSVASDAWERLEPHAGEFIKRRAEKWIDTLVWLGILVLASKLSWLLALAVLFLAFITLGK